MKLAVFARLVVLFVAALAAIPAYGVAEPRGVAQPALQEPTGAPSAAGERALLRRAGQLHGAGRSGAAEPSAAPATQPGQPGADVIVNNPADDTPERTTQSETSLAVRGNTICAGYNNSGPGGFSGLSRSADLGATWTDLGGLGGLGDPVIAVDLGTGTFYYADLGTTAPGVYRSTDDCQTFGARIPVGATLANTSVGDKPWIAVDNTGGARDGNVYACWTRFFNGTSQSELRFSRSTDGGATYIGEQVLQATGTGPFGCSVAVGPNGEVNVTWADRAGATANDIRFRRSTDGGVTFSAAVSVSTGNRHPGIDRIVTCEGTTTRATLNGDIRMLHQAWMAVDTTGGPFNGNIYVVWASDPTGTPDNSDAFFSRSTDGGVTWSAPIQVGAGGGATDQFEPFVAVGRNGDVSIAWYDRRNDPTNNLLIDVFKTFSGNGGVTLTPIVRVTDQNFGVPPLNPNFDPGVLDCYMGEYIAVASDQTNFYYLWGDNRNTLTTPAFPNGRPDPDVFFDRQRAPSAPATLTLAPKTATNTVGTQHCVTATVRDSAGNPTANVTVRFGVTGANSATGSSTTNTNGQAQFCYVGGHPGQDLITAFADTDGDNFRDAEEPSDQATKTWTSALDHFLVYDLKGGKPKFDSRPVTVRDQFGTTQPKVVSPLRLLNPVSKNGSEIKQPNAHLKCYSIKDKRFASRTVSVRNQFGTQQLHVRQARELCTPASKRVPPGEPGPLPMFLDHFRCYGARGGSINRTVTLRDQFGHRLVVVRKPDYLCNPASKNGSVVVDQIAHLVCYDLKTRQGFKKRKASLRDQFGIQTFEVRRPHKLCVPSEKFLDQPPGGR